MADKRTILIAPLDWGLGHATRCVPIINELLNYDVEIIIAAGDRPLAFLKGEYPDLQFIHLNGYDISYTSTGFMALKMLFQTPKLLYRIWLEHKRIKQIVQENSIDMLISDNRYGLWLAKSSPIKTIFITHQLNIKTPNWLSWTKPIIARINRYFISKYDHCWIPDLPGPENLAGELSYPKRSVQSATYIGPLSRFERKSNQIDDYDLLVILSGPEPQRSIFEKILVDQLSDKKLKTLMVLGKTEVNSSTRINDHLQLISHIPSIELSDAMQKSKMIIARAGYSTIMDLWKLGKKAILIPTPGQTEQEYLAKHFHSQGIFYSVTQKEFNLNIALKESEGFTGMQTGIKDQILMEEAVSRLLIEFKVPVLS